MRMAWPSVVLVAGTITGTAEITASFSDALHDTVAVSFVTPPTTAGIVLRVEPAILPADGGSEARLAVTSWGGRIVGSNSETQDGAAEATYVAGTSAGVVNLQTSSGSAQQSVPLVLMPLDGIAIALEAAPTSILADGIDVSTITATVTDMFGNRVASGTTVTFQTSLGVSEDVTPTDQVGTATAELRAIPLVTGTAHVTVGVGDVQETIDVDFVSESAAHVEAISVDPPAIGVPGAGDHETARVAFEVRDRNGIPVDAQHSVSLTFRIVVEEEATDAIVCPPSAETNDRGQVAATVNAGTESGAVEVCASTSSLESRPVRVAIHGGLPDTARRLSMR